MFKPHKANGVSDSRGLRPQDLRRIDVLVPPKHRRKKARKVWLLTGIWKGDNARPWHSFHYRPWTMRYEKERDALQAKASHEKSRYLCNYEWTITNLDASDRSTPEPTPHPLTSDECVPST